MSSLMAKLTGGATPAAPTPPSTEPLWPLPNVLITGESSTGKSYSFANMDWSRTAFIDTEIKGMPFPVNADFMRNYYPCEDHAQTMAAIKKVRQRADIRYVIIDGFTDFNDKAMIHERRANASAKDGFAAYKANTDWIIQFLDACKSRKQITIVTAIPETLTSTTDDGKGSALLRRAKVQGREMEGAVERSFVYAFVTKVFPGAEKPADRHKFLTRTDGYSLAKAPAGAFDEQYIHNDMAAILKVIESRISKA